MKIKVDRKKLLVAAKKVSLAAGIVDKKNLQSGILIEANADKRHLKLSATDNTIYMQMKLRDVDVGVTGAAVVPIKLFINMLSSLDGDDVGIIMSGNVMMMQSGEPIFTFNTADSKKFPVMNIPLPDETIRVHNLSKITGKTLMAADQKNSNPNFEGVYFRLSEEIATAFATNGTVFARSKEKYIADGNLETFIPLRAVQILSQIMRDDKEFYVGVKGNCITFLGEDIIFSTPTVNSDIVKTERIAERIRPKYGAVVDAKELANNLDLLIAMCGEKDYCVTISFSDNGLKLTDASKNGVFNGEVKGAECINSEGKGFCFNPVLIYKFARNCNGLIYLSVDENGFMKISDTTGEKWQTDYIVCPRRERVIKSKPEPKTKTETSKTKKGKAAKSAA